MCNFTISIAVIKYFLSTRARKIKQTGTENHSSLIWGRFYAPPGIARSLSTESENTRPSTSTLKTVLRRGRFRGGMHSDGELTTKRNGWLRS